MSTNEIQNNEQTPEADPFVFSEYAPKPLRVLMATQPENPVTRQLIELNFDLRLPKGQGLTTENVDRFFSQRSNWSSSFRELITPEIKTKESYARLMKTKVWKGINDPELPCRSGSFLRSLGYNSASGSPSPRTGMQATRPPTYSWTSVTPPEDLRDLLGGYYTDIQVRSDGELCDLTVDVAFEQTMVLRVPAQTTASVCVSLSADDLRDCFENPEDLSGYFDGCDLENLVREALEEGRADTDFSYDSFEYEDVEIDYDASYESDTIEMDFRGSIEIVEEEVRALLDLLPEQE